MGNLLGVEYFRLVKEVSNGGWSQVYAKIPLEKKSLKNKGGIFGVMRLSDGEDAVERGSNLVGEMEDEYGRLEGDALKELFEVLLKKESELDLSLVQILTEEGDKKKVRMMVAGSGFVDIVRGSSRIRLMSSVPGADNGGVLVGELSTGDRLVLGVGRADEFLKDNEESIMKVDLAEGVEEMSSQLFNKDWQESVGMLAIEIKSGLQGISDKEEGIKGEEERNLITSNKGSWFDGMKVKQRTLDGKKWPLWIAGIFLLILVISVVVGLKKSAVTEKRENFEAAMESVEKKREDGLALLSLNPTGARELVLEARKEAESVNLEIVGDYGDEWQRELEELDKAWERVSGEVAFEGELFFDLGLIREGLNGERIVYENENVFVLDANRGLVVSLGIVDKENEVVSGQVQNDWKDVVLVSDDLFGVKERGFVDSDGQAVYEFEDVVGGVRAGASFGSYVYVLDDVNGEIWRFRVGDDGVIGSRTRWLNEDVVSLKNGIDMAIDGDIWVARRESLVRLRRGNRESFELKNTPAGMEIERIAVWSEIDSENGYVAVLDKLHGEVLVFERQTGEYVKKWVYEGFKSASDLEFVSENRVLILVEGKLYEISI